MKTWYAWATPSGPINLMKAEDMPVKPELSAWERLSPATQSDCQLKIKEYEAALQAAKKSSVPIQDQEMALQLMWENDPKINNPISFGDWKHHKLYLGKVYGPFTVKYRIEDACAHDSCPVDAMCEHCKEPVKVAILYDDTEKDHYTILKEFAARMSKQEDIPKDIQAVVNKRFWDMLDTPEKEESQEDMLLEIFEDYKLLNISRDKEQFRAFIAMELSKFTITRKQ